MIRVHVVVGRSIKSVVENNFAGNTVLLSIYILAKKTRILRKSMMDVFAAFFERTICKPVITKEAHLKIIFRLL